MTRKPAPNSLLRRDLRKLLDAAASHEDKMVRYFAHSLMYRAWSKGAKEYAVPMRAALARETDSWAKGQCSNLVKAIDRAENKENPGSGSDE